MHTMMRYPVSVSAALLLAAAPLAAQQQDSWSWNSTLRPGQTLEIKGVNGGITATAAGSGEARVTAVRTARRSNPADVIFEVVEHPGGVTICAVYPHREGREPNECRPGAGGRNNVENNDVSVDFSVRVPNGVHFVGRTVNGGIDATGLPADGEARTVNGAVRISAAGLARAHTVNGSIDATLGRADWSGTLQFETTNGAVVVRMPRNLSADVSGSVVNGSIDTDFPLQVTGRFGPRRISGTIGSGGRKLELATVNGGISLKHN